jgi:hypothetical protein
VAHAGYPRRWRALHRLARRQSAVPATDKTFADPGKVALWTKADTVTHFDAIEITPLP